MAVLNTINGTSDGCGGGAANTGELGCEIEFGLVIHGIGLNSGTIIPAAQDVDIDYINTLIQAGTAVPLMNAFSSEPTFADDTVETSPLGVEALTLEGLPKFMLTMKKGQEYYKELAKLTGFGNIEWILGDVNGNWKMAKTSAGDFKGFACGQVNAMITTPATATETEKKSLTFQLTDRNEYDSNYDVFLASTLFPISDVKGINGVNLTFADASGAVPPADTDTTLKVKAVFASDNFTVIEGLVVGDFLYQVDGSTVVPSGVVDDGDGFYTLTVAAIATSEVLTVQNYDGSVNKNVVITSAGVLLRSNVLSAIVVV
jgi:hypothetical protein